MEMGGKREKRMRGREGREKEGRKRYSIINEPALQLRKSFSCPWKEVQAVATFQRKREETDSPTFPVSFRKQTKPFHANCTRNRNSPPSR